MSRTAPKKDSREAEIDIGYIDAHLKLRPLNRVSRLQPWNTSGLVEAPQFKTLQEKSTCKENYDVERAGHYFKKWKPHLYEKGNGSNMASHSYLNIQDYRKEHRMFDESKVNELLRERPTGPHTFKGHLKPNQHLNQKQ